jgi:hypothetical protein
MMLVLNRIFLMHFMFAREQFVPSAVPHLFDFVVVYSSSLPAFDANSNTRSPMHQYLSLEMY